MKWVSVSHNSDVLNSNPIEQRRAHFILWFLRSFPVVRHFIIVLRRHFCNVPYRQHGPSDLIPGLHIFQIYGRGREMLQMFWSCYSSCLGLCWLSIFLQVYCLSWGLVLSLWADVGIWQKELSRLDFDFAPIPSLALVLRNINRDCGVSPIWDEICFKLEKGIHKTWIYPIYWVNFHWCWRCTTFGIITVVLNLTIWGNTCFKLSKEGFLKR